MPVLAIGLIAAGNQLTAANMSLYGGNEGLVNITSGDNNVAVGDQSLADTTTGSQNTQLEKCHLSPIPLELEILHLADFLCTQIPQEEIM